MTRHAALLVLLGCAKQGEPVPGAEVERACASACAALTAGACPADEPTERRHAACRASCSTAAAVARTARCASEHLAYLSCVSRSAVCAPPNVAAGVALENGSGLSECHAPHQAYFRCTEPCRERGVLRTRSTPLEHDGGRREVHAELVSAGCTEPTPKTAKKSGAGAPCTHHSVCSTAECSCPASSVRYHARACVDGHCADSRLACAIAPKAVGHEPCRSGRP
jgi:hypothetical protein